MAWKSVWTALVAACAISSFAAGEAAPNSLGSKQKAKIYDSCFEIVVRKSAQDSLTYEKELPWDLVPFAVRNDKYRSIGTAFAISKTELITAYHVMELAQDSLVEQEYAIRDREGRVFEVDQINAFDQRKDFVRFTVKGRTFSNWLELNPAFQLNRTVFTAGNALGEGVIIRPGELIGTLPEPENGEWKILKSSADVNSGNSGGPLLDEKGKVIGLVLARNDNICQSLPAGEILNHPGPLGVGYMKAAYGFTLYPNRGPYVVYRREFRLPQGYRELTTAAAKALQEEYTRNMDLFFETNRDTIFPRGTVSDIARCAVPTSVFPETLFMDKDSGNWYLSDLKVKSTDIGDSGTVVLAMVDDTYYVRVAKPKSVALRELCDNPKTGMDLFLKGTSITRKIGNEDIRITSLGAPYESTPFRDAWGRPWTMNLWLIECTDQVVVAMCAPTPQGFVMICRYVPSALLKQWVYDMKKYVDFIYVPYSGKLKEWKEFLALGEKLPETVAGVKCDFQAGKSLSLQSGLFRIELGAVPLEIDEDTVLTINYGLVDKGGQTAWQPRRLLVSEAARNNYFVLNRRFRPSATMPENAVKQWRELVNQRHPYTGTAFTADELTAAGCVHPRFRGRKEAELEQVYTIYLAKEGTVAGEVVRQGLDALETGITITD